MNNNVTLEDKNRNGPTSGKTVRFNLEDTHEAGDRFGGPTPRPRPIPFWANDPNVLLDSRTMLEFYPVDTMTFAQKLNAVTRTVLVATIVALFVSAHPVRILFIGLLCLAGIWGMYEYYYNRQWVNQEGLANLNPSALADLDGKAAMPEAPPASGPPTVDGIPVYQQPTPENPFSNVLVSDYDNNPYKLPAPPSSNPVVHDLITQNVMQSVQQAHPNQPNITDKLYRDVNEQLNFEQSMRPFMSNPATTIPNDQGAFAQFCYGDMISCKEGNMFACGRNTGHYTNY
jgi:hypothetical protein